MKTIKIGPWDGEKHPKRLVRYMKQYKILGGGE